MSILVGLGRLGRLGGVAVFSIACALAACSSSSAGGSAPDAGASYPDPARLFAWTTAERLAGFSHGKELYATETFHAGTPKPLATTTMPAVTYQYGGATRTVDDYLTREHVAGLLILKDGKIALERYRGIDAQTRWQSMSVAKSVVSTLIGIALKEGKIASLDATIETYVPELVGTAYQGVTLRNVLRMASGVEWKEDEYDDPTSDAYHVLQTCLGNRTPRCALDRMRSKARRTDAATGKPIEQGTVWNYNTGEAYLAGLALQRATGRSLAQYLEEKVWKPGGMEADGVWISESDGGPSFGGIGFHATLRDYGRFGEFIRNDGALEGGSNPLPALWVKDATTWFAPSAIDGFADNGQYGYMWWFYPAFDDGINSPSPLTTKTGPVALQNTTRATPVKLTDRTSDWTFSGYGIYGQMLAINQAEKIVMVQLATWDHANPVDLTAFPDDPYNEEGVFLNAVIDALHGP
jgi:CubicO group peptidase (beta-lactamase class C family)